jgi:hypothetical protein
MAQDRHYIDPDTGKPLAGQPIPLYETKDRKYVEPAEAPDTPAAPLDLSASVTEDEVQDKPDRNEMAEAFTKQAKKAKVKRA